MRLGILVIATAALPACITIPPFTPPTPDASGDDTTGVSIYTEPDGSHTANGGNTYAIRFSASGYHYPYELDLTPESKDMLGGPQTPGCHDETDVGIGLAPSNRVDGNGQLGSGTFTILADGPALAEVDLAWTSTLTCTPPATISGHTLFALTPDNRIVRFDALDAPSAMVDASMCSCDATAATSWDLRSDFVVTTANFSQFVDRDLHAIVPSDTASQDQITCAFGPDASIAFGFQQPQVRVHDVSDGVAFTYDFLATNPPMLDTTTTIPPVTSAWLFGAGSGCAPLVDKLRAFGTDPQLAINGNPTSTAVDGVYGGNDGAGNVGASVGTTVTLAATTQPIPAAFIVWLDFGVTRSSFEITNPAQTGTSWFVTGRPLMGGDHQLIVWFRDELPVGQTITIVAGND